LRLEERKNGVRVLYCFKHQDIIIPLSPNAVKSEKCTLTPELRRVTLRPLLMLRQCQKAFHK
jgi:hypothetical protein